MKHKILNLSNLFTLLTILSCVWVTSELITPTLHYHLKQSAFLTGTHFFASFSNYPGGIADYLSEFIAQFFKFNLFGSILIVAIASLQGFIALAIVKPYLNHSKINYSIFTLILLFGILVLSNYKYPYYASIRLLVAFIFVWLFSIINKWNSSFGPLIWFAMAILLFYIADGFALFVFAISSVLVLLRSNKRPIRLLYIPVFLIFAGILPFLAYRYIFPEGIGNLYKIILTKPPAMHQYEPEHSIYIYYFLLPALLLLIVLFGYAMKMDSNPNRKAKHRSSTYNLILNSVLLLGQVAACFTIGYYGYIKSHDPNNKNLLYIEYYAEHEDWNNVLITAEKINRYDYRVNFYICRAYEHFGKLGDKLFEYPPLLGSQGLFMDIISKGNESMPISDLYFDMGFMDEAQHWAFEEQTFLPNSPRILKRLILINLVNRRYNLANKFLDILDKNMLYHDWVKKYKRYLNDTSLIEADALITEKRLFSPHKPTICAGNAERMKLLYDTNHDNRIAFDYLLSVLILEARYTEFIDYLQYFRQFNLKALPKSWEETLILYIAKYNIIPKKIPYEIITKDCTKRFNDFTAKMKLHKDNIQAAKSVHSKEYGKTNWYYVLYISPTIAKSLEKLNTVK